MKAALLGLVLLGTVVATAGATYVVTKANLSVSVSCPPAAAAVVPQSRPFPPLGDVPPTTGGKKW